jgi:hypothetical protein
MNVIPEKHTKLDIYIYMYISGCGQWSRALDVRLNEGAGISKDLNKIAKIGNSHICLREENVSLNLNMLGLDFCYLI